MKMGIFIFNVVLMMSLVSASGVYYDIGLKYELGELNVVSTNVVIEQFDRGIFLDDGLESYTLEILDFNGDVLNELEFSAPILEAYDILDDDGEYFIDGGIHKLNETIFNLLVPYSGEGKEILIYSSEGEVVVGSSLTQFSRDSRAVGSLEYNSQTQTPLVEDDGGGEGFREVSEEDSDWVWQILLGVLIVLVIVFIVLIL